MLKEKAEESTFRYVYGPLQMIDGLLFPFKSFNTRWWDDICYYSFFLGEGKRDYSIFLLLSLSLSPSIYLWFFETHFPIRIFFMSFFQKLACCKLGRIGHVPVLLIHFTASGTVWEKRQSPVYIGIFKMQCKKNIWQRTRQ